MENPRLLTSFWGAWCYKLDQKDIAVIVDSEYRSPAIIDEGIYGSKDSSVCQRYYLIFSTVPCVPSGATATGVIPLTRSFYLLPSPRPSMAINLLLVVL